MKRLLNDSRHRALHRHATGFTLIELMVTVMIVGILAAIAYPSYRSHVTKTHRDAAKACLSLHAQFMERYYTTKLTYVGATPDPGCKTESNMGDRYDFTSNDPAITATTYTVKAVPKGAQASADAKCGTLSITQNGTRGATGTGGTDKCW